MFDKGHLRCHEKRERCAAYIVSVLETAAREGKEAPPTWKIAKDFGISAKTCDKVFMGMRKDGRLSWRTIYIGSPLRQVRVVTVTASGLTTAEPPKPEPKPRKPRVRTEFKLKHRFEQVGISDRQLYGTLEQSVKLLRHRGFVVFKDRGGVRVGNQLLSFDEMVAKAAREARLMGGA